METALKLAELKAAFLKEWPLERLEKMSLEEYSDDSGNSFCDWLDTETIELGPVSRGLGHQFGVVFHYVEDEHYCPMEKGWKEKEGYAFPSFWGEGLKTAYETVRAEILRIAKAAENGDWETIAEIKLGSHEEVYLGDKEDGKQAFKWKIAFLYDKTNYLPPIFRLDELKAAVKKLGGKAEDNYLANYEYLAKKRGAEDVYRFSEDLQYLPLIKVLSNYKQQALQQLFEALKEKFPSEKERFPANVVLTIKNEKKIQLNINGGAISELWSKEGDFLRANFDECLVERQAENKSIAYQPNNVRNLERMVYDINFREKILDKLDVQSSTDKEMKKNGPSKSRENKQPNNQILFGPPGTGKTYNSINYALAILAGEDLEELNAIEKDNNLEKAQQIFSNLNLEGPFTTGREILRAAYAQYKELGQIQFTTFHQSMSYEDFVEGIKPVLEEEGEGNLSYEIKAGIFKQLAQLAAQNYLGENRLHAESSFDAVFAKFLAAWEAHPNMAFSLRRANSEFQIYAIDQEKGRIHFEKASGSRTHYLRIATLKEIFTGERDFNLKEGLGIYYQSILNALEQYATDSKIEAPKNYVLIIDEINRGNISEILGELITLLEEDKRLGQKESLEIVLPYSKDEFSVPPNLYVIGTMNTADRSVEALDAALRRRFSFVEMPPRPELLENTLVYGYAMEKLLWTINQRIERLLSKDHLIGHSYFLPIKNAEAPEKELALVVQHKILPLLQEYFYGDFGKIGLVLGQGFVRKEEETQIFAAMDYEPLMEEERFQLIPWAEVDLEMALAQLGLEKEA